MRCVEQALSDHREHREHRRINSSALFTHVLDDKKACPERGKVAALKDALKTLQRQAPPAPFYAVLLMDGDSLGAVLREHQPEQVSAALEAFTSKVPEIVDQHHGFLVYAGGDDVLALLPLVDALACATALRQLYLSAFRKALGLKKLA